MNEEIRAEELDGEIERLISDVRTSASANPDGDSNESFAATIPIPGSLLQIAAELSLMPSSEFKSRLKQELLDAAGETRISDPRWDETAPEFRPIEPDLLPTLTQRRFAVLPADPRNFLLSFLSHAAVVVLIASGIWAGHAVIQKKAPLVSELTYAPLPPGDMAPRGGGGGGDHSRIQASNGTPPKFSGEQLSPPAIVVRNSAAKLQVQPTVLGPPQLKLPESKQIGDLFSQNVVIPSNGTGSRGGIGSNEGTGIGSGLDAGVGSGSIAGYGGGPYRPGNGVSSPRAIYDPDPEYSDEARKARYQGIVVLTLVVDPSGRAREIHVARALGMGLDEKAIAAVKQWRFAPGMKDGHPVAVQVNVEVNFRLY